MPEKGKSVVDRQFCLFWVLLGSPALSSDIAPTLLSAPPRTPLRGPDEVWGFPTFFRYPSFSESRRVFG
ncbi:hypothetical protein NUU61_006457 [Penicillium alfredii]|uniref:Secreted protein n=1 Tax=Penicillium alfredii TaxID=1506179 RepID=A0A9W9F0X9_9EURO|nr:uncharacterized protein NUU61_006457 [Penicillium alfredii]KAJ5091587.1 hypothetical protein NUU61_006457 [Penicillium alfredii]